MYDNQRFDFHLAGISELAASSFL